VEFPEFLTPEDFLEAMVVLRDKYGQAPLLVSQSYGPLRAALRREREKHLVEFVRSDRELAHIPGDTEEEHFLLTVHMLVQVEYVPSVLEEEVCNSGNQSLPVRA
jgi:hypothetical protein